MDRIAFGELYTQAAMLALRHTVQLLIWSEDKIGVFEPLGTGVLMTIDNRYYLITAGHCLRQYGKQIKIGVLNGTGNMTLIRGATVINSGPRDTIDLGIVKLSNTSIATLQECHKFLTVKNAMFNDGIAQEIAYLVLGFPLTKTDINNRAKKISIEPLVHIGVSKPTAFYDNLGYSQSSNIILGFNRRKSQFYDVEEMNMSPNPKGVSGGGLWFVQQNESGEIEYYLCGIMIEHDQKKNVMIATKTEEFRRLMHELESYDANTGDRLT